MSAGTSLGRARRMVEGNENLFCPSPWDFKRSLTCHKILRHGTSGFISHPQEGVLRIFIALKNPSPWPGSDPRPLGPVASTLTTTPPMRFLQSVPGVFSPGLKRGRGVTLTIHPSGAKVKNKWKLQILSPKRLHGV
jgi:hypothetical protein